MKIGVVIDRLNIGGVEKIAIEQVRALRQIGIDATLVVLRRKAVVKDSFVDLLQNIPILYLDDRFIPLLRIDLKFPVFYFFSLFHLTYPFIAPFYVKKDEFDYLLTHGTYTGFTTLRIQNKAKIPGSIFIWDPIGYILEKVYINRFPYVIFYFLKMIATVLDKLLIKGFKNVLVGGKAHVTYLSSLHNTASILLSPPSTHLHTPNTAKDGNFCLLVTAWKEGKSPEFIFEILKKIPNLNVVLAGKWIDPNYEMKFRKNSENLGFSSRISILGAISEEQLINLYKEALLLLQINDDRGFGMPALEAASCGTTFIIPKDQGVCELFEHNTDGYFVNEKDVNDITNLIEYLLSNKKVAIKMGLSAWGKVKKSYSWESHARKLIDVIKKDLMIR